MPFRPGTGTPYGNSAFAFAISAAETCRTGAADSSSLGGCDDLSSAGDVAAAADASRELDRRVARGAFVG